MRRGSSSDRGVEQNIVLWRQQLTKGGHQDESPSLEIPSPDLILDTGGQQLVLPVYLSNTKSFIAEQKPNPLAGSPVQSARHGLGDGECAQDAASRASFRPLRLRAAPAHLSRPQAARCKFTEPQGEVARKTLISVNS